MGLPGALARVSPRPGCSTAAGRIPPRRAARAAPAAPINRSPRAMPLPTTEWAPPVTPPDEGPWPAKKPRVQLAYATPSGTSAANAEPGSMDEPEQPLPNPPERAREMQMTDAARAKRDQIAARLENLAKPPPEIEQAAATVDGALAAWRAEAADLRIQLETLDAQIGVTEPLDPAIAATARAQRAAAAHAREQKWDENWKGSLRPRRATPQGHRRRAAGDRGPARCHRANARRERAHGEDLQQPRRRSGSLPPS